MSKMNQAKMATLSDKIYDQEAEQETKRAKKPRIRLIRKKRGSSRTSKRKSKKTDKK